MRFRTVLIDLDGTLIDHLPAIHRCYCHTLPQLGLPAPTRDQVLRAIGGGLENAMLNFVTREQLPEGLAIFRAHWAKTMLDDVVLMPGGAQLLAALHARGCAIAVFTNKHGPSSRSICDHLGVTRYLRGVYGAHDTPYFKPDAAFSRHVLAALDATPETTCLIGDSPFDVQTGLNAGFPCFCVTTGSHSSKELLAAGATADAIFPDLPTLGKAVFDI